MLFTDQLNYPPDNEKVVIWTPPIFRHVTSTLKQKLGEHEAAYQAAVHEISATLPTVNSVNTEKLRFLF